MIHTATMLTVAIALFGTGPKRPTTTELQGCLVSLIEEVKVPAEEEGRLVALEAREGLQVEAETLLGLVDDTMARMQQKVAKADHDVAELQADTDVQIEVAIKASQVTQAEYEQAIDANKQARGALSLAEVRRRWFAWDRSKSEIKKARMDKEVAKLTAIGKAAELEAAGAGIERRRIKAPIDGVIIEVFHHVGEWVSPGEPVFHLVRMNRLRVEGFLNAGQFDPGDVVGHATKVKVRLAHGEATFDGKIVFAHPLVDAKGEFKVWAEVDNRQDRAGQWLLRPGLTANMTIDLRTSTAEHRAGEASQRR